MQKATGSRVALSCDNISKPVNLLLTSSTVPEARAEILEFWNRFFIADFMPASELASYLKFAPAASAATVDAIIFLRPELPIAYAFGNAREIAPWKAARVNAAIAHGIRDLPENCAMRDGRKWKRIPIIVLTEGYREPAYGGVDVDFVIDDTALILNHGLVSTLTRRQLEETVNRYQRAILAEYQRVGFLVTDDHGLYRIKKAYRKKTAGESEYYFSGKDRRRFRGFVTISRDSDGISYEASLFEELLNDPTAGEREVHNFLEQHPALLAEAMTGVPVSHQPYFASNKQNADYSISPIMPRSTGETVDLLELKGPEAKVLDSSRYLHRALSHDVFRAIAQVNDYNEAMRDPLNLPWIERALGYVPERARTAVLIGRNPSPQDHELWEKRKAEQPMVRIVTYDELLEEHHRRHSWRG